MNTEQEREAFEDWILQGMDKNLPGHQNTLARYPSGNYMTYSIAKQWDSWQARAALQSQDAERIINAARVAMDESFDHDDGYQDLISIPAEKAAALSLALDEYDASRRVEEKT